MKNRFLSTAAGLIMGLSLISFAGANPNYENHENLFEDADFYQHISSRGAKRRMKALSKLDLSDDQKAQVKEIIKSSFDDNKPLKETLKGYHKEMKALMHADTIDESSIKTLSSQIAITKADLLIANIKNRKQIHALLTDDQKLKAKEMRKKWKGKRGSRGKRD